VGVNISSSPLYRTVVGLVEVRILWSYGDMFTPERYLRTTRTARVQLGLYTISPIPIPILCAE